MANPKELEALEWKIALLAFEFQNVSLKEVQHIVKVAWVFAPEDRLNTEGQGPEDLLRAS
jgi:hypothetical protein